jgi:hypothetical protein
MKIRVLVLMILIVSLARLMPHPFNFTPIGAMFIFSAAFFDRRWLGLIVPFLSLFLTDLLVNNVWNSAFYFGQFVWFTPAAWTIYAGFAAYFLMGTIAFHKNISPKSIVLSAIFGSIIFFFLTNFGSFLTDPMYPKTTSGLATCLAAGLPFYQNTILGDLCFTGILFGSYAILQKKILALAF